MASSIAPTISTHNETELGRRGLQSLRPSITRHIKRRRHEVQFFSQSSDHAPCSHEAVDLAPRSTTCIRNKRRRLCSPFHSRGQ